jgi:pterin-4a-carbinolamine dehydratase
MNTTTTNHPTQALDVPGQTGLKAERIQIASTGEIRLKAERIQLALRDLPGWHLSRSARRIARTYELPDGLQMARLLRYVADLAAAGADLPEIQVGQGEVTFTLPTLGGSWIEAESFEMAKALEIQA